MSAADIWCQVPARCCAGMDKHSESQSHLCCCSQWQPMAAMGLPGLFSFFKNLRGMALMLQGPKAEGRPCWQ